MRVQRAKAVNPHRDVKSRYKLVLKPGPWRSENPYRKPEKPVSKRRKIISHALIAAGGALCLCVTGTYTWMYARQELLLRQWNSHNPAVTHTLTKLSIPRLKVEDVVLEGI